MPSFFRLRYADFSASLVFDNNSCRRFLIHSEFGFIFPTKFWDFRENYVFTYYIYIIYINLVELYIRVDAFRLSKALLFPLPKNDKKLLCSIWDYHTPSWVPPSIGSPLAWSYELTWFQVPLLLCAAVQAQPLLSVWHSPKYRVWFIVSLVYDGKRSEHYQPPKNNAANEWNLKKLVGGIYIRTLADIAMCFRFSGAKLI